MSTVRDFLEKRPLGVLRMGTLLSLLAMIGLVTMHVTSYSRTRDLRNQQFALERVAGEIAYLDEVLTTAARLSVATGDPRWERRYRDNEARLQAAIERAQALSTTKTDLQQTAVTSAANDRLIELESQAFALARTGRATSAQAILDGEAYANAKKEYAAGIQVLTDSLRGEVRRASEKEQQQTLRAGVVTFAVLIPTWLFVLFLINSYIRRQRLSAVELNAAKERAERASLVKNDFISQMSHELRTPLGSVIGFANLMLRNKNGTLTPKDIDFLSRIRSNGEHLLDLINRLLDLAKIEAGKMDVELATTSLNALVREVGNLLEGRVQSERVALEVVLPPGEVDAYTDAARLRQVLINLAGNAIKFTESGTVTLRLTQPDHSGSVAIEVSDTGVGIPPDRLTAIFDRFEQATRTTQQQFGGTGLGLAISKAICDALGYDLSVTSRPGEGSTFSIRVPAAAAARALVPTAAAQARAIEGKRILIIDDDPDARVLLATHIADLGGTTTYAESGEQGIALARSDPPDLITLDLVMPGLSGWDTLRALKDDPRTAQVPVIVVAVDAPGENSREAIGQLDLVSKPVTRDQLVAALNRNLPAATGTTLLVENDPDMLELWRSYISDTGFGVRVASNGIEALAVLESFTPDVVVLDLMMPEMDGFAFLRAIRSDVRWRRLPVIVATAKELTSEERSTLERETLIILKKGATSAAEFEAALTAAIYRTPDASTAGPHTATIVKSFRPAGS